MPKVEASSTPSNIKAEFVLSPEDSTGMLFKVLGENPGEETKGATRV
jgi:hypothetical protein